MAARRPVSTSGARAATPSLDVSSPRAAKTSADSVETPRTPGGRLAARASASLSSFTSSPRFLRLCNDTFNTCDVDNSGSIDSGELFAAILLLNHHLNSLPLGKRQQPPTREKVTKLFKAHARGKSSLDRQGFVAVCQELCTELATGVPRNMFVVFVMCPIMATGAKTFMLRTLGGLHPFLAMCVNHVPDALFVPIATSLLTVAVPLLIAKHDEMVARRRAASSRRLSRVGVSRTEQTVGLLVALIFPLFFALAWPIVEPTLDALFGNQARAARAAAAPYLQPLAARGGRALDAVVPLWHEVSALTTSYILRPWRAQ